MALDKAQRLQRKRVHNKAAAQSNLRQPKKPLNSFMVCGWGSWPSFIIVTLQFLHNADLQLWSQLARPSLKLALGDSAMHQAKISQHLGDLWKQLALDLRYTFKTISAEMKRLGVVACGDGSFMLLPEIPYRLDQAAAMTRDIHDATHIQRTATVEVNTVVALWHQTHQRFEETGLIAAFVAACPSPHTVTHFDIGAFDSAQMQLAFPSPPSHDLALEMHALVPSMSTVSQHSALLAPFDELPGMDFQDLAWMNDELLDLLNF
jgi:hypothetical protein